MKEEKFFATCPKSLEQLLEQELIELGATHTKQSVAGVYFTASIGQAYRICLWSRLANRILLPLTTLMVADADGLYNAANCVKWDEHMTNDTTFVVNFTGVSEKIIHTQFAAQKIKDAIVDQFRKKTGHRPSIDKDNPMLRINAILRKGKLTLSIDLSGESLHKRGYRLSGGDAPLKENLAAALLYRAKWPEIANKGGCLLDPMCGSGTLLIEGVQMIADIAPNLQRKKFGFQGWKKFQAEVWEPILQEAQARAKKGKSLLLTNIFGFDVNPAVLLEAKDNIKRAGLANYIQLQEQDIKRLSGHQIQKMYGLCITNPPYGERLFEEAELLPLYRTLAKKLKEQFLNWEAAILTGNAEISKQMGLRAYKKYPFFNGTIACQLLLFHLQPEWFITPDK